MAAWWEPWLPLAKEILLPWIEKWVLHLVDVLLQLVASWCPGLRGT